MKETVKDHALVYLDKGKSIIPVGPDKKPLLPWQEFQVRRPSKDEVLSWFSQWPKANIALPTGKINNVTVIDCDSDEANEKFLNLCPVARETLIAKTPRGFHYYFDHEDGVRNDAGTRLGEGIDVRGDGGYVLIPPSVLADGRNYSWCNLRNRVRLPVEVAQAIVKLLDQPTVPRPSTSGPNEGIVHEGGRNQYLTKVGGALKRHASSFDAVLNCLREVNQNQCVPPLRDDEVVTIARSVMRYPTTDGPAPRLTSHDLVTLDLSTVKPEPVHWLWRDRIPLGRITMIEGDGGVAKSWLTMDIAAHVTTGRPFYPDGSKCPQGNVIIVSAEDDPAEVIVPRLIGQQADLTKVKAVSAVNDSDGERPFTLENVDRLELLIQDVSPKLVIIDPIVAYLGSTDMNSAKGVRALLTPLQNIAQKYQLAIIIVRHLNKASEQGAQYRGQGSQDFYSACRSCFQVVPDSVDRDVRHLVQTKSNLGKWATTLEYTLVNDHIEFVGQNYDTAEILHGKLAESRRKAREQATATTSMGPAIVKDIFPGAKVIN